MKKASTLVIMLDSQDFEFSHNFSTVLDFKNKNSKKKHKKIFDLISEFEGSKIFLFNKSDKLKSPQNFSEIEINFNHLNLEEKAYLISLKSPTGHSSEDIKKKISELMQVKLKEFEKLSNRNDILFHKNRHLTILTSLSWKIDEFLKSKNIMDLDKRAHILRDCLKEVENLTGSVWTEEILDVIFEEFCIGK